MNRPRDKDAISRTMLTGNAVCTVTRMFNKFPIEVELKVRYNKIHGENRFPRVVSSSFSSGLFWKLFGISRERFSYPAYNEVFSHSGIRDSLEIASRFDDQTMKLLINSIGEEG